MKNIKSKKIGMLVLSTGILFGGLGFANGASAASNGKVGTSNVSEESEYSIVLTPTKDVKKEDWNPEYDEKVLKGEENVITPMIHGSKKLTDSSTSSNVQAQFSTSISHPTLETSATFSGSSKALWLGSSPFNADKIKLTDKYSVNGINVSVSVPGGVGFTGSGSSASWTGSRSNDWAIYHSYSGIKFSGFAIYSVSQSASANVTIGRNNYTTQANDSFLI